MFIKNKSSKLRSTKKRNIVFRFLLIASVFQPIKKIDLSSKTTSHQRAEIVRLNHIDQHLETYSITRKVGIESTENIDNLNETIISELLDIRGVVLTGSDGFSLKLPSHKKPCNPGNSGARARVNFRKNNVGRLGPGPSSPNKGSSNPHSFSNSPKASLQTPSEKIAHRSPSAKPQEKKKNMTRNRPNTNPPKKNGQTYRNIILKKEGLIIRQKQVVDKTYHAKAFKVKVNDLENPDRASINAYIEKIIEHIKAEDTKRIEGTYRINPDGGFDAGGFDAIHFFDNVTQLDVIFKKDTGEFVTAWRLGNNQAKDLRNNKNVT